MTYRHEGIKKSVESLAERIVHDGWGEDYVAVTFLCGEPFHIIRIKGSETANDYRYINGKWERGV